MVPHYETQEDSRVRRYHGCKIDGNIGPDVKELDDKGKETGRVLKQGAVVWHSDVFELPNRGEYLRHLRDKDLWPADEATASLAGVPFDPKYGGEHDIAPPSPPKPAPVPTPSGKV
jgi:hypothetical protein